MKRPVALLDVDHTIIFGMDTNVLNVTLLNSLESNGVRDLYLFTDMTFENYAIQERNEIIINLEKMGFAVHGVMTSCDLTWSFVPEDEAQRLHELCNEEQKYTGKLAGQEFIDFILESQKDLPTVASEALSYQPDQIPGHAYAEAASYHRDNKGDLSENIILRSRFAKACSDNLISGMRYTHTKGLMLDLFLRNLPKWVGSIVVADDNKEVINTINNFQSVEDDTFIPPLTMIPVTSQHLDRDYYDQQLGIHQQKIHLSAKLNKLMTTRLNVNVGAVGSKAIDDALPSGKPQGFQVNFDEKPFSDPLLSKLASHIRGLKKIDNNLPDLIDALEKFQEIFTMPTKPTSMQKSLQKQRAERAILEKTNVFLEAFLDDTKTADDKMNIIRDYENAVYPYRKLKTICKCVGVIIVSALCAATGAAIGLGIGALAGAWSGPGAIVTAFAGMFSGAATAWTVGVTVGTALAGAAGFGLTVASYHAFFKPAPIQQAVDSLLETSRRFCWGKSSLEGG